MPTFTINKKGGYEPIEVDAYINSLEQQLKEYENKASAINKAIISAQMASDKMIKQANEETAAVIKKANEESSVVLKKANEEAAEILRKANEEKNKIMAEAQKCSAALAENADKQIQDIKNTIAQQKTLINNFNKDYAALVDKYLKSYDAEATAGITKNLDEIDALVSEWQKNGIPEPSAPKQNVPQPSVQHRVSPFGGANIPKPAAQVPVHVSSQETKPEAPKAAEPAPSPLAASSVSKPEEAPKQETPKPFVKTGLAGGAGMGGIPANPSYGLGGERTLKNSVSHSEAPKAAEPAPEPVSAANINVPKFGEAAAAEAPKPAAEAPKPGIYKVTADNHLYNENRTIPAPASPVAPAQAVPDKADAPSAAPASKPGIYKVTSDNKLYNDNTDK